MSCELPCTLEGSNNSPRQYLTYRIKDRPIEGRQKQFDEGYLSQHTYPLHLPRFFLRKQFQLNPKPSRENLVELPDDSHDIALVVGFPVPLTNGKAFYRRAWDRLKDFAEATLDGVKILLNVQGEEGIPPLP